MAEQRRDRDVGQHTQGLTGSLLCRSASDVNVNNFSVSSIVIVLHHGFYRFSVFARPNFFISWRSAETDVIGALSVGIASASLSLITLLLLLRFPRLYRPTR